MVIKMSKKKGLNQFILLPLFLGAVTLVAAGALTGVHLLTKPKIAENVKQKQLEGYKKVLDLELSAVIDLAAQTVSDDLAQIGVTNKYRVTIDNEEVGVVYDANIKAWEPDLIFQVGFREDYYSGFNLISTKETPSIGGVYLDGVNDRIKGVKIGDPILNDSDPSYTGQTAPVTAGALRTALEACAQDYLEGRNA
jgi:Na+-translocating ferredoxin:NAD+ oxidoreductase RnfG subunit